MSLFDGLESGRLLLFAGLRGYYIPLLICISLGVYDMLYPHLDIIQVSTHVFDRHFHGHVNHSDAPSIFFLHLSKAEVHDIIWQTLIVGKEVRLTNGKRIVEANLLKTVGYGRKGESYLQTSGAICDCAVGLPALIYL